MQGGPRSHKHTWLIFGPAEPYDHRCSAYIRGVIGPARLPFGIPPRAASDLLWVVTTPKALDKSV